MSLVSRSKLTWVLRHVFCLAVMTWGMMIARDASAQPVFSITQFASHPRTVDHPASFYFVVQGGGTTVTSVELWRAPYELGICDETTNACDWSAGAIVSMQPLDAGDGMYTGSLTDSSPAGEYMYGLHAVNHLSQIAFEPQRIRVSRSSALINVRSDLVVLKHGAWTGSNAGTGTVGVQQVFQFRVRNQSATTASSSGFPIRFYVNNVYVPSEQLFSSALPAGGITPVPGLNCSSVDGVFCWTPPSPGTYMIQIKADTTSVQTTLDCSGTIVGSNTELNESNNCLPSAYSLTVSSAPIQPDFTTLKHGAWSLSNTGTATAGVSQVFQYQIRNTGAGSGGNIRARLYVNSGSGYTYVSPEEFVGVQIAPNSNWPASPGVDCASVPSDGAFCWTPSSAGVYTVRIKSDAADTTTLDCTSGAGGNMDETSESNNCSDEFTLTVSAAADTLAPGVTSFEMIPTSGAGSFTANWTVTDNQQLQRVELWRAKYVTNATISRAPIPLIRVARAQPGTECTETNKLGCVWLKVGESAWSTSVPARGPWMGAIQDTPPTVDKWWYGIHVYDLAGNRAFEPSPPGQLLVTKTQAAGPPPDVPVVEGPLTAGRGQSIPYGTFSSGPAGILIEYKFDWGDGTPTVWSMPEDPGVRIVETHSWANEGVKCVRVSARDAVTQAMSTSPCHNVTVTAPPQSCGNNAREGTEECDGSDYGGVTCQSRGFAGGTLSCVNCVIQTTQCTSPPPSSCTATISTGSSITVQVSATDPDIGDQVYYSISWGDSSPVTRLPGSGYVASGTARQTPHQYNAPGEFTVTATATDNAAPPATSIASNALKICVTGSPACTPGDSCTAIVSGQSCSGTFSNTCVCQDVPGDSCPSIFEVGKLRSDLSCDCKVDVRDLGILFFFWGRSVTDQVNVKSACGVTLFSIGKGTLDTIVNEDDLAVLLGEWGTTGSTCAITLHQTTLNS